MDLTMNANATGAQGALIVDSSTANFQADVIDASRTTPVLVDFWAPWCGPCKTLTPALERVVTALQGKVKLVKINVDENQALAGQLGVQSIPTVFGFVGGRPVDGFMGAIAESEIAKFCQKLIDGAARAGVKNQSEGESQIEAALEGARQALEAEDYERAYQIYALVLQHVPDSQPALVGVATVQFKTGDLEAAKQTLAMLPEDASNADGEALARAIALAEEAEKLGDPEALKTRLAGDPDDHAARFDLAMIHNARGEKLEAAQALIEIMRRDREWREDGARLKLLELFEAWGPKDQATMKGRRLLSALLFR
ncbi:thioredoxin [Pelagibacterium xiamenense]|uniref:thioredoxin n=1 Tax=Pelagibacterium xiamenense TaxID=2901140 RepID=UPI001E29B3A6|nr:thioredoxin [Pelagibacterium xiamenense]MCD7058405.1 thioredoxin [Pelagibacterium xiamenense]